MGMKPVNEPWKFTPIKVLKEYYWKSYKRVKALALLWKFIIHDSFRFGLAFWADFLLGCPNIAFDMHIYQAWNSPGTIEDFFSNACQQKYVITKMEDAMMPVIVGEWSIGTDNSAMWLIGFNDNLPGFPKVQCHMVDCPINSTYLSDGFQCPVTSQSFFHQHDDAALTRALTLKELNGVAVGHGWYFWNFKTEIHYKVEFLGLGSSGSIPQERVKVPQR
ncbi:unnamed protein product [Peronospora farinosa]|nr:unnamed protein product [Peronospora farinosa]